MSIKPATQRKLQNSDYDDFDLELSRIIVLSEEVTQEITGEIINRIMRINDKDDRLSSLDKKYVREPIKLIINSTGGSIYDGLGIIDCIDASVTPVHTICYGSAMSMAMIILACGHVRICGRYSTIMYHEGAYEANAKIETHKQELKEIERTEKICDDILLDRTKLTKRKLQLIKASRGEWYITAKEALRMKIIDKIS